MARGAPRATRRAGRRARPPALQGQGRAGSSRTSRKFSTWRRSPPPRPARVMRALSTASQTLLEAPEGAHHARAGRRPRDRRRRTPSRTARVVLPLTLAVRDATPSSSSRTSARSSTPSRTSSRPLNDAGWTGGAFVYVPRGVRVEHADPADRDRRRRRHRAAPARADRARGGRRGRGLGAAPLRLRPTPRRCSTPIVELRRRPERPPALRRRPGHEREVVGLRLPARRGGPRRAPRLGRGRLRLRATARCCTETLLAGEGSHAKVTGAYAPHARQHVDFDTHAGARRGQHDVRPRVPRHPRRPLDARSGAG